MSQILETRSSNNMTATAITLLFFMGLFFSGAECDDLTTIQWFDCNEQTVSTSDPYATAVTNLLSSIASTAPNQPNYEFSTSNTEQGETAYGYGNCTTDIVSSSDQCGDCLSTCIGMFLPFCGPAIGAQIKLTACYVRYENHSFR